MQVVQVLMTQHSVFAIVSADSFANKYWGDTNSHDYSTVIHGVRVDVSAMTFAITAARGQTDYPEASLDYFGVREHRERQ